MRGLLFFMMLLFGLNSFSQKLDSVQQVIIINDIESADVYYDFKSVIDSCDKYLLYKHDNCVFEAKLYGYKAYALEQFVHSLWDDCDYEDEFKLDSLESETELEIMQLYRKAILYIHNYS